MSAWRLRWVDHQWPPATLRQPKGHIPGLPSSRCRLWKAGSSFRFSSHMPRPVTTPVESVALAISRHSLLDCFASLTPLGQPSGLAISAALRFSITLLDLLPHVTFTGLRYSSGGCEPPCGLRDSLCTLQSCCLPAVSKGARRAISATLRFPIHRPPRQPPGSCCSRGASREVPMG